MRKTAEEIARRVTQKLAFASFESPQIAQILANNADDVLMAMIRHKQMQQKEGMSEDLARNYFFMNPYGLDFHTWAGMQQEPFSEEIPMEEMPVEEGEEPPYDSETEAAYMPNAPEESTEPTVSPAPAVPVPAGRTKKQASALLSLVAVSELRRKGLLKSANGDEEGKPVVRQKVEEFLRRNKAPEDSAFHSFAEREGYNPHAAEEVVYQIASGKLGNDLIPGGKAKGKPDSAFSSKQLEMGQEIEKEHTPDAAKAREISKDHLEEFPDYYTALKKMEEQLKAKHAALGPKRGVEVSKKRGNPYKIPRALKGIMGALALGGLGVGGYNLYRLGRKEAAEKFGLDASALVGQDEERKQELHDQQVRHNEETHQLDMAKQQLELQQTQETFSLKQQQQAQKDEAQMAQQQMAQQMQAQQQQQMSQQYLSNMSGGGGQQPPQQGYQAPQ